MPDRIDPEIAPPSGRLEREKGAMRIALLAPAFWPEVRRGTERVLDQLGAGLAEAGHEATVIAGHQGRWSDKRDDGYRVILVPRFGEGAAQRLLRAHERLGHLPAERIALSRLAPQLANSFYPTDAATAGGWARRNDAASVFSVMGMPNPQAIGGRRLRRELWKRALERSSAVVVLSEAAARLTRKLGCEPVVIHPGTDLAAFRRNCRSAPDPTIVCPAAIGDERKRVGLLVDAFRVVRRRYPKARLILSGPEASGKFAGDGVEIRNLDAQPDLNASYSEAWLTVLPSLQEAFGLVLVESLACGTAVLASNDAGCPEVIGDSPRVGSYFGAATTASELADEIAAALDSFDESDPTLAARRDRARMFSTGAAIAEYIALYTRLLALEN